MCVYPSTCKLIKERCVQQKTLHAALQNRPACTSLPNPPSVISCLSVLKSGCKSTLYYTALMLYAAYMLNVDICLISFMFFCTNTRVDDTTLKILLFNISFFFPLSVIYSCVAQTQWLNSHCNFKLCVSLQEPDHQNRSSRSSPGSLVKMEKS